MKKYYLWSTISNRWLDKPGYGFTDEISKAYKFTEEEVAAAINKVIGIDTGIIKLPVPKKPKVAKLKVPASRLKNVRAALDKARSNGSLYENYTYYVQLMNAIDRHRPLNTEGRHVEHTKTCGCTKEERNK